MHQEASFFAHLKKGNITLPLSCTHPHTHTFTFTTHRQMLHVHAHTHRALRSLKLLYIKCCYF